MNRLRTIAGNVAFCASVCVSVASFCLWVSTRWTDVRLDRRTAHSRYVFASVHGMFHFQWHDEPGRVFPCPTIGYDWSFGGRTLNWQFLNPIATTRATSIHTVPRAKRKETWFVSFPMPVITCTFGFVAVAIYRRRRKRSIGMSYRETQPATSVSP